MKTLLIIVIILVLLITGFIVGYYKGIKDLEQEIDDGIQKIKHWESDKHDNDSSGNKIS